MKANASNEDYLNDLLDQPYVHEPDLTPINLERRDSGLTNRKMAQRRLVEKATAGDMAALKILQKYLFPNTQNV